MKRRKATRAIKETVFVGIPAYRGDLSAGLGQYLYSLGLSSADPRSPYVFLVKVLPYIRPQHLARNTLIDIMLNETRASRLWFIDDDMLPEETTAAILETDADIAGCFQLRFDEDNLDTLVESKMVPCAFNRRDDDKMDGLPYRQGVIESCDAVGSGSMVIRRKVLEDPRMHVEPDMKPPAVFTDRYAANGERLRGLDIDFCFRAVELGYTVKVNWNSRIGHRKTVDLNQVYQYAFKAYATGVMGRENYEDTLAKIRQG